MKDDETPALASLSSEPPSDEGPNFGPLSSPFPRAVHALNHPDTPDTPNDPRLLYDLTDARHAERFAQEFGDQLKFVKPRGGWLKYDGTRWSEGSAAAVRYAIRFAKMRQHGALEIKDLSIRTQAVQHAIRAETRAAIDNTLSLARSLLPMYDAGENWDQQPLLLADPDGSVLNLQTGLLRRMTPGDRITLVTNTPFHPGATAPRWRRFIEEIVGGDRELAAFVQRAVGYSLTGDVSEQVAFLLVGNGANGKSTFLATLTEVLGDYSHVMPFSAVERSNRGAIPNDLAALVGRRFVTASEPNEGARWNEARLKSLTGSEPITARFLHSEFFTFRPVAKFWFGMNAKPDVHDDSYGFWRRLCLIPFPCTFPIDKELAPTLRSEATGILAWAVEGCTAWLRDGLGAPPIVLAATEEYRQSTDPLSEFLETAIEHDDQAEVGAHELYLHYKDWARARGFSDREVLTATKFGRLMTARLPKGRTSGGAVYQGIARKGVAGFLQ